MTDKMIYKAILGVMTDLDAITKDQTNKDQGWQYRGIDDMYNVFHPLFAKHRIFITTECLEKTREERPTRSGGVMITSLIKVKYIFNAEDGSSVYSILEGEGANTSDKSINKALSVSLKYALMQMFLVPTEDSIDPDSESPEMLPKNEPPTEAEMQANLNMEKDHAEFIDTFMNEHEKSIRPKSVKLQKAFVDSLLKAKDYYRVTHPESKKYIDGEIERRLTL